jgi:heme/copper-type cytochrome/quinol oxidase subunit 3
MAKTSIAHRLDEPLPRGAARVPAFGGGGPPAPPIRPVPLGSNAWLAVLITLGAETMFFAGLIGAYIVFRVGSPVWPPPFQPRLPVGVTGVNTMMLLVSAVTMRLALSAAQQGNRVRLLRFLAVTSGLGAVFLIVQGLEWVRLIHFGLTVSSSVYGGLFYTLIGFHGLHVLVGLIWVVTVLVLASRGRFTRQQHTGVQTCSMYWLFVVGLWPVLYGLVYLY